MTWLLVIFAIVALAAWGAAMWNAVSIMGLAPRGTKIARYYDLGFWRFHKLANELGSAAVPHTLRYRQAFVVFFAAILGIAVTAVLAGS